MESSSKMKYKIPFEDVYKIHLLNKEGNISSIYIFCANQYEKSQLSDLFSDLELAYFEAHDVELVFSPLLIHKDDTIRNMKRKIIQEMESHASEKKEDFSCSPEEMYLFSSKKMDISLYSVFQEITQNKRSTITKNEYLHYANLLNLNPFTLDEHLEVENHKPLRSDKMEYNYSDWMQLVNTQKGDFFVPLGMEFQDHYDMLFPVNPYFAKMGSPIRYQFKPKNGLFTMENSLLLNYIYSPNNSLMLCLGKDVYEYAQANEISQTYMTQLYFPQLENQSIRDYDSLMNEKHRLYEEYQKEYSPWLRHRNEIVDLFYEIYWSRKKTSQHSADLPYMEKGIQEVMFTMQSEENKSVFPLEYLFKQIHSTEDVPYIKYNPGYRRESMFRLYSKEISRNGKKIPFLDETLLFRLNREMKRGKLLSLYLHQDEPLYVYIDHYGKIMVHCKLKSPLEKEILEKHLVQNLASLFQTMQTLLQPLGYELPLFRSFQDYHVKHLNIHYGFSLALDNKVSLQNKHYLQSVFDVIETNLNKTALLRYKRVENYKEMDAKTAMITEYIGRGASNEDILDLLITNFGLDREAAILEFGEFRSQHQLFKERVLENPGFPLSMKMKPLKNELLVSIQDISSVEYLDNLFVYLDTFLRLSQQPKTIGLEKSRITFFEKKYVGKQEEEVVENVIQVVSQEKPVQDFAAQPLRFGEDEQKEEPAATNRGIVFEEDYDYDYEDEQEGPSNEEEEDDEYYGGQKDIDLEERKKELDGKSIKNPTPFFRKMMELDPTLFVTEETSKYPLYSKTCPSVDRRQPVILTKEEKERIDETNPGSYGHALLHGSDPNNQHYYICPRYWCLLTNSSMTEQDVKAGKCGNIIPRGAETIPKGAYVYEFNTPKYHMKNGSYTQTVPGFLKREKHPQNMCVPCCFGKEWDSKDQKNRRALCDYEGEEKIDAQEGKEQKKGMTAKTQSYIIGPVSYPLPENRWGFMPISAQLFFDEDSNRLVEPQNPSVILPNVPCLLRKGIEQSDKRSFIGAVAYYYAYKQGLEKIPSIEEMSKILATNITLDLFVKVQNGNLPNIFRPKQINVDQIDIDKYSDTQFFKKIDLKEESQLEFLEDTIAAYENFLNYVQDITAEMDHTFLYDIVSMPNSNLMRDGLNWVILKISDNDMQEKVQYMCPSNAYSGVQYDRRKETVILLLQDIYYEPLHLYENSETIVESRKNKVVYTLKRGEMVYKNEVLNANKDVIYTLKQKETRSNNVTMKKAFLEHSALEYIKEIMVMIKEVSKKYCHPLPSMPKKYVFKRALPLVDLMRLLKTHHYVVDEQVINYRNKTIGLRVKREQGQALLYVPCYPSAVLDNLPTKYMDDPELWLDYRTTRDRLQGIHNESEGKIPCQVKVKIVEDNLVIGFLTETNQFVQVNPPSQVLDEDSIPIVRHSSYGYGKDGAEKTLTTSKIEDKERIKTVKKVDLETEFYNVFRSLARLLLHEQENNDLREEILETIQNKRLVYRKQLMVMEQKLRKLMDSYVSFQEIEEKDYNNVHKIMICKDKESCESTSNDSWKMCLRSEEDKCKNVFPRNNLLAPNYENNKVYYGRLADELLRYDRIRVFMFEPKKYLNIGPSQYVINDDELFMLESILQKDYFLDLVPYSRNAFVKNIEYDNAQPNITQNYQASVSVKEQKEIEQKVENEKEPQMADYILDCISQTKPRVIGKDRSGSWKMLFPTSAKEIIFQQSHVCSYMPLIYIMQDIHKGVNISVQNIKTSLYNGYKTLLENAVNKDKIIAILKKQGKRKLMTNVKSNQYTLEEVIFSENYYLTDLDYWVFASFNKIPIILFATTTLKQLSVEINWLQLGGTGKANEAFYFVRTTSGVLNANEPMAYHLVIPAQPLENMKNTMFVEGRQGQAQYQDNVQTLENYLSKYHIIRK